MHSPIRAGNEAFNPMRIIADRGAPVAKTHFRSFDGGVAANGLLQRPDRYRFWTTSSASTIPVIPRGASLSYSAASFCEDGLSVEHGAFDRVLDFDSGQHIVEVEAGINLSALHDFLSARGLFLPIQPGHGRITVGGCIAVDVHGKNHARDGTFINQVVGLTLFHPEHGLIELSPEIEPILFRLTCGGYGLTGHVLRAKLRASPITSDIIALKTMPVDDVWSGCERLEREAMGADFAYTWHDFTLTESRFGRGYLFLGNFVSAVAKLSLPTGINHHIPPALSAAERGRWRLPFLNRRTTRIMNSAYRIKQKVHGGHQLVKLRDALFPIHNTQFYFKFFGTRGFHEYQAVISTERLPEYLAAVRDYVGRSSIAVTLASAKLFRGRRELLRFTGQGICFALNFPRTPHSWPFLKFLDELTISLGGIPNIIKDSRLPRAVVEACYPEVQTFRDQLSSFDPKRMFRSELSERLGL